MNFREFPFLMPTILFNYDISLCETSLSNSEFVADNILRGYNYHPHNHTSGEKKGGVGIFYKDSLPIKIRGDLSFHECIVAELRFGRKKYFLQYCIDMLCIKLTVLTFLILLITLGTCIRNFLARNLIS